MNGDADKLRASLHAQLSQEIAKKQKEVHEGWKKLEEKICERGKRLNESLRYVSLKWAFLQIPNMHVFCAIGITSYRTIAVSDMHVQHRYQEYKKEEQDALEWIRQMKGSIEKEATPKSLIDAEAALKRLEQRKTDMDGHNAAFTATSSLADKLLSSQPPIFPTEIKQGMAHVKQVLHISLFQIS